MSTVHVRKQSGGRHGLRSVLVPLSVVLFMAPRPAVATAMGARRDPGASSARPAVSPPDTSGYRFLGDLASFDRTSSGVTLHCAPGADLRIAFLAPDVFRVTLVRPDQDESLLDLPLAKADWPEVRLQFRNESDRLVLTSERLRLEALKRPCRLRVLDVDGALIDEDDAGMGIGWDSDEVRDWKVITPSHRFFGLGEKTGALDKRGQEWVMWNTDHYAYGPNSDPLYESIPFLLALRDGRAYGIYLNNSSRTTFNLNAGNHRYYSLAAAQGPLDYYFFYGPAVPQVVARYTELTGRPPMPPRWALGYQQSRWSYYPAADVLRLAHTFREKRIPADVIYLDIHYMNGYRVFTWDHDRFPDPAGMLRTLRALGFHVVVIIDPGVKADTTGYAPAREGLADGHFIRYPDGQVYVGSVWPGPAYFPDFSRPATRDWWAGHLNALRQQGVAGFWDDMNEPAVWGQAFPTEALLEDGGRYSSMKRMHNLYGLLMAQAAYEGLLAREPDERPFVLTRAGFSGIQSYAAVWTGDNVASAEHLALGIRMMLGMGISGVPFVGTDVGGFAGTPTGELFARWMQVGAFSPFFRAHTEINTPPQEPWSYGETVENVSRAAIDLRYRLLPYLYSLFWQAHTTGAPILRPLFWSYQQDAAAYESAFQEEFLVGDRLLVAPVTRMGQMVKSVYLPPGRWLDLSTDSVYQGGRRLLVETPLQKIPMFLGAGGILPTGPVLQSTSADPSATPGGGGVADTAPDLTLDLFAGTERDSLELYEDDGHTTGYLRGQYRVTRFTITGTGVAGRAGARGSLTWRRTAVHDGYAVGPRRLILRFHAVTAPPTAVMADGARLPPDTYAYDASRRILTIHLAETGRDQEVRVIY